MQSQDINNSGLSGDSLRVAAKRLHYRKNLNDFFSRELKITTKALGGAQSFVPNAVQAPIVQGAEKQLREKGYIRQIIFKCRQPGISTYTSGVIWNRISLYEGVYAFIVAQDRGTVANIFQMHDVFRKRMSNDMQRPLKYYNKGSEIVLGNPSSKSDDSLDSRLLVGEAKNIHLGVGRTIHFLHLSEVCRYPSDDPIKESLIPACSDFPGTVRIFESTAHFGSGAAWFQDQCEQAMSGKGIYEYFFVEWWKLPEYRVPLFKGEKLKLDSEEKFLVKKYKLTDENLKWRREKISELRGDVDMFRLSYPMNYKEAWIAKMNTAFPRDALMEMRQHIRPPVERFSVVNGRLYGDPDGLLYVWVKPKKNGIYDIGADVGGGIDDKGDPSVAEVIDRRTTEQCAEWRGHVRPREFADILAAIGHWYNEAQIGNEVNAEGNSTMERLRDVYFNIYLWRKRDTIVPRITGKLGWVTSGGDNGSKNVIVNLGIDKLYYRQTIIHSEVLWEEMHNFVRDFTPTGMPLYYAATGHDDCVMAWLIALQISDDENLEKYNKTVTETTVEKPAYIEPAFYDANWEKDLNGGINDHSLQVDTRPWR